MRFVCIDFETATQDQNSACSIGIITVEDGQITDEYYSLIKPPGLKFNDQNIQIHEITPEMVADAPTFAEIWPEVQKRLEQRVIFAHNAGFDMGVLKGTLEYYGLQLPKLWYACSLSLSRKVWPKLTSHKLSSMAEFLSVEFKHHNAIQDAYACAQIVLRSHAELKCEDLRAVVAKSQLTITKIGG